MLPSPAISHSYQAVFAIFADSIHYLATVCRASIVVPEAAPEHVFVAHTVPTHGSTGLPLIGSSVVNGSANRCNILYIGTQNHLFSIGFVRVLVAT